MTTRKLYGECVICGEKVYSDDDPAEMHNPLKHAFEKVAGPSPSEWFGQGPQEGICHVQCGLSKGWEIS